MGDLQDMVWGVPVTCPFIENNTLPNPDIRHRRKKKGPQSKADIKISLLAYNLVHKVSDQCPILIFLVRHVMN